MEFESMLVIPTGFHGNENVKIPLLFIKSPIGSLI